MKSVECVPGVMAQTGMETSEIIEGVVHITQAGCGDCYI